MIGNRLYLGEIVALVGRERRGRTMKEQMFVDVLNRSADLRDALARLVTASNLLESSGNKADTFDLVSARNRLEDCARVERLALRRVLDSADRQINRGRAGEGDSQEALPL